MPEPTPKRRAMDQTDIATSQFALVARELIKLITSLRALGAQADFDLPRIAVIGNQSAGKSSLVEAISGISVPRSHGTCTRCPMECRLTNSEEPWRCQILLRREMDETGQRSPTKEENFGPLLRDKSELEEMIRRAQLAVLNPGLSATFFETFDTRCLPLGAKPVQSPKQLAFSSSVVCLDLAGPNLPDLSFIDLPGIISTVDKGEDKGNIDAVKAMVQEHIKGNTLILLTITMRDDINNQGAAHLAQLADPSGGRTIGVLTKPDLIQDGEEDGWLKILQGSSHQLTHGYFITKHPSPKELEEHVSHEDAREREAKFFETSPPWSYKVELRSRMGTPSLTRELSTLLGALIRKSLPALREEADASLRAVKESLDRLPPPPSDNPATELLQMVNSIFVDVQALVNGADGFERLLQRCRPAHQQLKFDILSTAPNFKPFKSETGNSNGFKAVIDQDDADFQESGTHVSKALYLDNIKSYIQSSLTRQLPFNVPFSVKVDLIKRSFENWEAHCLTCFDTIHRATVAELRSLAQQYFGGFSGTTLLADVRLLVDDLVEKHRLKTLELVKFQLELEDPPFTVNDHYFSACRDNYLAQYKAASKPAQVAADPIVVRQVLASLASLGYNVTQGDLAKLQKEDKYDEEFIVMAETSAYFRVAYKRVIDNIPRVIDHAFLRAIVKELYPTLVTGLALAGDNAAEQAARYLAEDHQVRAERRHLTQKKGRLEEALKELRKFQLFVDPEEGVHSDGLQPTLSPGLALRDTTIMSSSDKRPSEDPLVKRRGRISSSSVNTPAPATAVPPTPLIPDMTRSQNIGDLPRTTAALAGSLPPVSPSVQNPSSTPQPPREPPGYTAQAMSASHCAEISKPHFPFSSAPTSSFGPTSELPSHMAQPVRADYSAESFNWDFSSDSCSGPIDTPASYFSPGPPAGATTAPVYDGSPMEAVRSKFPMRVTEISSSFLTALNNVPYNGIPGVLAGSSMIPFSSFREEDPVNSSRMLHYENISCMPAYQSAHADELRVQDYQQGRRPAVMPPRNAEPAPLDTYLTPLPPARGGQGPPANRAPATAIVSAATFQYRDESLDPSPGSKKRTAHRKNRDR